MSCGNPVHGGGFNPEMLIEYRHNGVRPQRLHHKYLADLAKLLTKYPHSARVREFADFYGVQPAPPIPSTPAEAIRLISFEQIENLVPVHVDNAGAPVMKPGAKIHPDVMAELEAEALRERLREARGEASAEFRAEARLSGEPQFAPLRPMPQRSNIGRRVRVKPGHRPTQYDGLEGVVEKLGRTRYHVRVPGYGQLVTLPPELAEFL